MQLTQEPSEGYFFVRACSPQAITIVDRPLTHSFVLAPDQVIENWPVTNAAEFDEAAAETIAALKLEVVLLGTGEKQVFPPREALVSLLRKRIGVEVMDNAAASRTYNLLASEGRRAVAAFMLPRT